jgi:hypothetical protein
MFDQFIWQATNSNETDHIKVLYITSGTDTAAGYRGGKQSQEKEISFMKTLTFTAFISRNECSWNESF